LSDEELIETFAAEGAAPGAAERLGAGTPGWSEPDRDPDPALHPASEATSRVAATILGSS
jgi:hypothetical protein